MFELTITNYCDSTFALHPENKYGFSNDLHESTIFSSQKITISGLRYKGVKSDFFETKNYVVAIVGLVFYRLTYSPNCSTVSADEILRQYMQHGEGILKYLKGNFIIAVYNKDENKLWLAKDILGLTYLYYKLDNETFYISTNLIDFKKIPGNVNYAAVIEKMLFSYPIGKESFLENVYMLEEGGIIHAEDGKFWKENYNTIDSFFKHQKPLKKFDKQTFFEIFEKSLIQRASVDSNINVSLTGGYDGRTNVAILLHHKKKFHSYSFGKKGGENTNVPIKIAEKLGLDYEPIFLDEEYEHNYFRCAYDAIYFSDGISNFERANYIYAMEKIVDYGRYNITGLIGGEIFAPVHLKTDYINSTYFDVVYRGMEFSIEALLVEKGIKEFIRDEISGNKLTLQKITNDIEERRKLVNDWKNEEFGWLYYLKDFMTLGFHQFFGNQIHLERYYNENLSPFYDSDVIEYLFSTRHLIIYQNAFKDSPLLRRKNRKLQTLIIDRFSKELASIPVDRGYPPKYSKDIRQLLIPFIFYLRRYKLKRRAPEFDSPTWSKILYKELSKNASYFSNEFLNSAATTEALGKYKRKDYNKSFNQLLSIAIWLKQ